MARKTAEEIGGFEYDWIACDADGNVGFFSTAGGGYAPPEFSADTDVVDKAIEAIVTSPARTTARFAPNLPSGHTNTWRLMAERGGLHSTLISTADRIVWWQRLRLPHTLQTCHQRQCRSLGEPHCEIYAFALRP